MAEAPTVKVVSVTDLRSINPQRIGRVDKVVAYKTPDGQTYAVAVPAETFSEDTVRAAIRADLKERAAWTGKSLNL